MQLYSLSRYASAMVNPRWLDDLSTRTDLLTESDARKLWRFRNRKLRNLFRGAYSGCAEISEGIVVHGSDVLVGYRIFRVIERVNYAEPFRDRNARKSASQTLP